MTGFEVQWTTEAITGFVALMLMPIFLVFMAWFYVRRTRQPIKARVPDLVLYTDALLVLYYFFIAFRKVAAEHYSCGLSFWSDYICLVGIGNCYCLRAWILYYRHQKAHELLGAHKVIMKSRRNLLVPDGSGGDGATAKRGLATESSDGSDQFYFTRNTQWSQRRFLVRALAGVSLALFIPPAIVTVVKWDEIDRIDQDCNDQGSIFLFPLYALLYVGMFFFIARKIRHVIDAFFIRQELGMSGLGALVATVVWLCWSGLPGLKGVNKDVFPFSTVTILLLIVIMFALSTVYPLYKTYHIAPEYKEDVPSMIATFNDVLRHPRALDLFREFLATEFSLENLLFYEEVHDIKAAIRRMVKKKKPVEAISAYVDTHVRKLAIKYIRASAPMEINIIARIKEKFQILFPLSPEELCKPQMSMLDLGLDDMEDDDDLDFAMTGSASMPVALNKAGQNGSNGNGDGDEDDIELEERSSRDALAVPDDDLSSVRVEVSGNSSSANTRGSLLRSASVDATMKIDGVEFDERTSDILVAVDEAVNQAFNLMKTDSYPRWKCTDDYYEFAEDLRAKHRRVSALERAS